MQGLYQLNRLTKDRSVSLPAIPNQRFYRLWIVEDHMEWTTGPTDQPLNLAGTLWFFPKHFKPGIPHHEVEGFSFWFDDGFLRHNALLQDADEAAPWRVRQPFVVYAAASFDTIRNLCREHQAYLSGAKSLSPALTYASATLILLHLREATSGQLPPQVRPKEDALIASFIDLINQHYQQQHQPHFYAEMLHVSPATLRRRCQESCGQSPGELIRQKLLEQAKKYLLESRHSNKQIASVLGFEDESYFVRFFRQRVLLSPMAYRRAFLPNQ